MVVLKSKLFRILEYLVAARFGLAKKTCYWYMNGYFCSPKRQCLSPRDEKFAVYKIVSTVLLVGLVACAGPNAQTDLDKLIQVETVLVLPFYHIEDIRAEPVIVDCDICRRRHAFEMVKADDAAFMSMQMMDLLQNDGTYQYIFHDQAKLANTDLDYDNLIPRDFRKIVATEAMLQGVDAVLMGYIFRFRERVGTSYAIESPASVSFALFLVDVVDGQVVWHSQYEETQDALFNNLLALDKFIKRKARWVTARELAVEAIADTLSTLLNP